VESLGCEKTVMTHADTTWTRRDFVARLGGAAVGLAASGLSAERALGGGHPGGGDHDGAIVPTAWFDLSLDLVRSAGGFSPPVAARAFAYAGMTLYEAVAPGMPGYRSLEDLFGDLEGLPRAGGRGHDWPTTANAALASILRSLISTAGPAELHAAAMLEARFERYFRRALPPSVVDRSVQRGRDVADAIFAWSRSDGGHEGYLRNFPPYIPPVGPGLWVPTPPSFLSALQPLWGGNRCFAIGNGAAFPPGDHPRYSEAPRSRFWREAKEVYAPSTR
jgi:hypothetical protein